MDNAGRVLLAVVGSILSLAFVSAVLSQKANTVNVLNAGSTGLANLITAATSPITGNQATTSYASASTGTFNSFLSQLENSYLQ